MARYFIEVAYKGTRFSGFQVQQNAITIQSEIENALKVCFKMEFSLTGSSRTDAGVHALQNFFHFDSEEPTITDPRRIYNLNAILPADIVVKRIFPVSNTAHCRFDALSREYSYYLYHKKDPFLRETAFYFPYPVDIILLNRAAARLMQQIDFTSFSKKNSQVNNFNCTLYKSTWLKDEHRLIYNVCANRFLRGMVKGLVGTMLLVGTKKINLEQFEHIIVSKDPARANFAVPSHGLFLEKVNY